MKTHALKGMVVFFTLLGLFALSQTIGFAQEKVEGMVVKLQIDKCGMKPGTCEGMVGIGEPGKARTLSIEAGTTTIKKGDKVVVLQELRLGDQVAAKVERKNGKEIAKVIEVREGPMKH